MLRHAAVVAANIGCTAAIPVLIERIEHDTEPLIRSHALWALNQLDADKANYLIERSLNDADPLVRHEAASLIEAETP
jgi:epoxyqueuosine reductase